MPKKDKSAIDNDFRILKKIKSNSIGSFFDRLYEPDIITASSDPGIMRYIPADPDAHLSGERSRYPPLFE